MRIYLSGPMTGQKDLNRKAFMAVGEELKKEGHFVINPHVFTPIFGTADEIADSFRWLWRGIGRGISKDYARSDMQTKLAAAVIDAELAALRSCDAIYLLRGWENSRGARKELAEAIAHGLSIISEGAEA